jgi:hypothetical protein
VIIATALIFLASQSHPIVTGGSDSEAHQCGGTLPVGSGLNFSYSGDLKSPDLKSLKMSFGFVVLPLFISMFFPLASSAASFHHGFSSTTEGLRPSVMQPHDNMANASITK